MSALELVAEAIGRAAAGQPVDIAEVRRRVAGSATLVHPALRSDRRPGIDGLHPDDAIGPLLVVLDVLERESAGAAADRLAAYYPEAVTSAD